MRRWKRADRQNGSEDVSSASIRRAAMDLLARREFSRNELRDRLVERFGTHELIEDALETLVSDGLQSDERYAESLVRSRRARQQGPVRIRYDLVNKGVTESLAEKYADARDPDWYQLARDYRSRRFGDDLPKDPKERARQQRHLLQRGFDHEHIRYAMSNRD